MNQEILNGNEFSGKPESEYKEPIKKDRCPCCNKKMFKLKTGQWTHLISEAYNINLIN